MMKCLETVKINGRKWWSVEKQLELMAESDKVLRNYWMDGTKWWNVEKQYEWIAQNDEMLRNKLEWTAQNDEILRNSRNGWHKMTKYWETVGMDGTK